MLEKIKKFLSKYIIYILVLVITVVIVFLIADFLNPKYTLALLGDNYIEMYQDDSYQEPGYVAYDKNGKDVKNKVQVIGNLNVHVEGTYKLKYKIGNEIKYREIKVTKSPASELIISLNDNDKIYLWKNSEFSLPKASALDKIDGDISNKVVTTGSFDIEKNGTYKIKYSITNSRKITKSLDLTIIVRDLIYQYEEKYINQNYTGIFKINDDIYNKVILPDNTTITNNEFSFVYSKNGLYIYKFYDKKGNMNELEIEVTGADKVKPNVSCEVYLYDNNSEVKVNATDNVGIKNYRYEYGGKSELLTANSLKYSIDTDDVKVTVSDIVGNENSAICKKIDKSTKYGRSYTQEKNGYNYWLYIPPTLSKRNTLPLVIFFHGRGECGNNLNLVNKNSFPKYINEGKDYDFVMIAPQNKETECIGLINETQIKSIIDDVINKYNLDEKRVFVTGFSYGAKITYRMVKAYPSFFAGAIPVAFDPPFTDYSSLYDTPIYAFHGTADTQRYTHHKNALSDIINHNSKSKFFSVDGADHVQTPPVVYENNQEVLDFIASTIR